MRRETARGRRARLGASGSRIARCLPHPRRKPPALGARTFGLRADSLGAASGAARRGCGSRPTASGIRGRRATLFAAGRCAWRQGRPVERRRARGAEPSPGSASMSGPRKRCACRSGAHVRSSRLSHPGGGSRAPSQGQRSPSHVSSPGRDPPGAAQVVEVGRASAGGRANPTSDAVTSITSGRQGRATVVPPLRAIPSGVRAGCGPALGGLHQQNRDWVVRFGVDMTRSPSGARFGRSRRGAPRGTCRPLPCGDQVVGGGQRLAAADAKSISSPCPARARGRLEDSAAASIRSPWRQRAVFGEEAGAAPTSARSARSAASVMLVARNAPSIAREY